MVKSRSFGGVLLNYLNKSLIILLILSVFPSSYATSLDELEKKWLEKIDSCVDFSRNNEVPFPKSDWFDSLKLEDKRNVVGYLANYNTRQCSKSETEALLEAISKENAQEVFEKHAVDLMPLKNQATEKMKNIDMDKLMELQMQFYEPFSLMYVMEQQGWLPQK